MSKDRHIRLSDDDAERLHVLSLKLGTSENEVMRRMIENADSVDVSKLREKSRHDDLVLANLKYQNYLFSNATKSLNQIAHVLNAGGVNDGVQAVFEKMVDVVNVWREEMKNYGNREVDPDIKRRR